MKPRRRVTRFVHIRVPGVPTVQRMTEIRERYIAGTLDLDRTPHGIIDIAVDGEFTVGACHHRRDMIAGPDVETIARSADAAIRAALPNSDPVIFVTSAQYVISVTQIIKTRRRRVTFVQHTDDREAKVRHNSSWLIPRMWSVHANWRFRNWCWPRFVIYDSDAQDGSLVWSWVIHLGPFWIIRHRYAM